MRNVYLIRDQLICLYLANNRNIQWHNGRVAVLQCQISRFIPDYGAVCTEFVRSPCDHVGFHLVLWFPPTF